VGNLVKGSFVRRREDGCIGVVSEVRPDGYAYVRWLLSWDETVRAARYWLDYVNMGDVEELPGNEVTEPLFDIKRLILG
jgi:hypothetical protein